MVPNKIQKLEEESLLIREQVLKTLDPANIKVMSKEDLLDVQTRLKLGGVWGTIDFPEHWLPPGASRAKSMRVLNLADISGTRQLQVRELALLTLTRISVLLFLVPTRHNVVLKKSTIATIIRSVCKLVGIVAADCAPSAVALFSNLSSSSLLAMARDSKLTTEVNRLIDFGSRGYLDDTPQIGHFHPTSSEVLGVENIGHIDEIVAPAPRTYLPFSDDFTAELAFRCHWLVENIDASLIHCLAECVSILAKSDCKAVDKTAAEQVSKQEISDYLSAYIWRDRNKNRLSSLPFPIHFRVKKCDEGGQWPPKSLSDICHLANTLMAVHMMTFFLSEGSRASECLSLLPDYIVESRGGINSVYGRTYKLEFPEGGTLRDWTLPDIALLALHNQKLMRNYFGRVSFDTRSPIMASLDDSLWVNVNTGRELGASYHYLIIQSISRLGLGHLSDDIRPHSHRFRKTLARLAGLAMVGSPKILMDLFSHRDIEMTLSYMLSDPGFRAEVEEVARAQTIMLAKDVIVNSDNLGGPAGNPIAEAVRAEKARHGREFGINEITKFAETLTLGGTYWVFVRPGIICTKLAQEAGPCNKGVERPEPSRCRSFCSYRVEMGFLKNDVDGIISNSINHLKTCIASGDFIMAEAWRGQLVANITRFREIQLKYQSVPEVYYILKQEGIELL